MRAFHRKIQYPHPLGRGVMEQDMEKPSGGKKKPRRFRLPGLSIGNVILALGDQHQQTSTGHAAAAVTRLPQNKKKAPDSV